MMQPLVTYGFRPWVRRAGLSIVGVAAAATGLVLLLWATAPRARYGWAGEPAVWLYLMALWAGGLRVWLGTLRPVAELGDRIVVRPLHLLRSRVVAWSAVRGTEQMQRGDRLILYYDTRRGMRYVALNLNLVRGRRDFLAQLEARLGEMGFRERVVGETRYLSPAR